MRSERAPGRVAAGLLACGGLLAAAGFGRADVVTLTNGNRISGKVVSEDASQVVVRTQGGKVTLPRHMVAGIELETEGDTLLSEARQRIRAGAYDEAEEILRRAMEHPDPGTADRAREELEALREQRERARRYRRPPSTPLDLPEGTEGEPVEGETLQEQLDRARRALERDDYRRAQRLLRPLLDANRDSDVLRYLYGRALELEPRGASRAREHYVKVLGPRFDRDRRETAWLGEIARRKLAGEEIGPATAGVGGKWRRVTTEHFVIYHPFPRIEGWLRDEPEDALLDALERLEVLEREVAFDGLVQVFLYEDRDAYIEAHEDDRAAGHARHRQAPDGVLVQISAWPSRELYMGTFRHEVAHAVVPQVASPALPTWAHEGAATWVEPARFRATYLRFALGARTTGDLPELLPFLRDELDRGESRLEGRAFYGLATAVFHALVDLRGSPRAALELCDEIGRRGPEEALDRARIRVERLEERVTHHMEHHAETE